MKKIRLFSFAAFVMAVSLIGVMSSCTRIPLYSARSNYALNAVLDTAGLYDVSAGIISVNFYDPKSGKLVYESFQKPGVSALHGFAAGTYRMLVYNFDTKKTSVYEKSRWEEIYATSNVLSRSGNIPILTAPDHLMICRDTLITVPVVVEGEQTYVINANMVPETTGWEIYVHGVHNATIATSIATFISGHEQYDMLGKGERPGSQAILYPDTTLAISQTDTTILSRFASFGISPEAPRNRFTLMISGPAGSQYTAQEDITPKIEAALKDGKRTHRIDVYVDIKVEPRKDGGFNPTADQWKDEIETIDIK